MLTTLIFAGLAALVVHYLYGGISVGERGLRVSRAFTVQMGITAAAILLVVGANFWLGRYATLQNDSGDWTGAMYTDVNAVIPTKAILAIAAVLVAVMCIVGAVVGRWRLPMIGTAMLLVVSLVAGGLYPWIVQRFQVQPTEQSMENPYIQRNIDMTRDAYGLSDLESTNYDATVDSAKGALRNDSQSISNIRLLTRTWSPPPSPSCSSSVPTTSSARPCPWTATTSTAPPRTP
ncbi:Uncharacterised protein family (UPF0182) [Rothia kristinae]|nr:Uncharacterised protein family (UPF0182) [Rothia kristinae]